MSWGYKVDSGIFSPLMENIYFRTLIATNLNDLMDQEILQCTMTNKYLGKCWGAINMISLYFAHLWLGLTHTIVFVSSEVQIEREWLIFYVTVGSPLNVCKTAHIFALFTHTHTQLLSSPFQFSLSELWWQWSSLFSSLCECEITKACILWRWNRSLITVKG